MTCFIIAFAQSLNFSFLLSIFHICFKYWTNLLYHSLLAMVSIVYLSHMPSDITKGYVVFLNCGLCHHWCCSVSLSLFPSIFLSLMSVSNIEQLYWTHSPLAFATIVPLLHLLSDITTQFVIYFVVACFISAFAQSHHLFFLLSVFHICFKYCTTLLYHSLLAMFSVVSLLHMLNDITKGFAIYIVVACFIIAFAQSRHLFFLLSVFHTCFKYWHPYCTIHY